MRVMSGLDARFLASETATSHMHTIKVVVLDTSARTEPLTAEGLPAMIEDRLRRMPVLRTRVVAVPYELGNPVVVDDPDFDLSRHLRVATAAAPGGRRQLDDVVAGIAGTPLPRDRPLWELTVVEGLAEDRVAFVMKLHHALADGIASVALLENAFVVDDGDAVVEDFRPEPLPTGRSLYRSAANGAARRLVSAPGLAARTVAGYRRARSARRAEEVRPPGPFAGPRTGFNVALTADRTFATAVLGMPALVAAKEAAGVSLNDVFLAVCGGGVRRYLARRGALPGRSLTASVPMATRTGSHRLSGNHVDNLFLRLHTELADPVERVRAIHAESTSARRIRAALGPELFEERADAVPPFVHSLANASVGATRLAGRLRPPLNVVASCVRGPRTPLEVDGGTVTALFSSGPILEGIGLNLTAWTYVDTMSVSVLGCSASLPDPERLAADLEAELHDWAPDS